MRATCETGMEKYGIRVGIRRTWATKLEIKLGIRGMEWGCSESGLTCMGNWVKM